jgi:hypothetical protein
MHFTYNKGVLALDNLRSKKFRIFLKNSGFPKVHAIPMLARGNCLVGCKPPVEALETLVGASDDAMAFLRAGQEHVDASSPIGCETTQSALGASPRGGLWT